jgi:hypothetical protein
MEMSIEAMKQALEALTDHGAPYLRHGVDWDDAITALRAAIAEQEKCEPVAWRPINDAQWVNLVNHAHAWEGFSKDEAVHEVVKMTEVKCRENNTHPEHVPVGWLRAVDEAMVCFHLGVADASDSYEVAKKKLNDLICWNVQVATDPAVNGGMRLVPVEPTPEMLLALYGNRFVGEALYKAMLAAAPKTGENHE